MNKQAIIIGAGPAGLTAAYELLKRTDIKPIILEKSGDIGGISKTINYKGNRIDIGGHRFFSKSDRVMNWWLHMMPLQTDTPNSFTISYQNKSREITETNSIAGKDPDKVMLVRNRLSRIYFLRKFFTYPIQLSFDTLTKLGLWTTIAIMFSYLKAQLLPRKPEKNLEDFMVNRFGEVLYKLFFKDYTEKVWGIPCNAISAEWGAQRIKGVSISKAIQHAVQSAMKSKQKAAGKDISQKDTETSLIEQFLYPKYGPGQLWEEVARQVQEMGGTILKHHDVKRIYTSVDNPQITAISAINNITGEASYLEGDYFFSTMPVQELIGGMDGSIPDAVKHVASGLQYRDFITVGILLKKLSFQDKKTGEWKPLDLKDTWIYIQEKDVKVGRLQLFNNWSPYMVKDPDTAWVGMEFFCNTEDNFWKLPDDEIKQLAISELEKIGLASASNVLDTTVLRVEKTYPAYFGTYDRFDVIREYVDKFENLFLVGRNGMHKYNNSDHSMLTAMVAVDNIAAGVVSKDNIWAINTEQEYHEEKAGASEPAAAVKEDVPAPEPEDVTSIRYLLKSKENKITLALYAIVLLIQFVILKKEFPFVSFMPDSYNYLASAYHNAEVNMWPIGYGKFLRFFSLFTHSDTLLALTQYLVLELSMLYFALVLFALLKPTRPIKYIIIAFLLINPGLAIVSNYVSSDAMFTALSLVWFIQLISIYKAKSKRAIFIQAILLFILISFRYTAIYYPIIAIIILLLTKLNWRTRVIGITITVFFPLLFVWHTSNKYKEITGIRQFSPFGGWQMASNALTMYRYNTNLSAYHVPNKYKDFHALVTKHLDSLNHLKVRPDTTFGIYYLWDERAPMRAYMTKKIGKDTLTNPFIYWAKMAPFYNDYGRILIENNLGLYFKYYILPNVIRYLVPPVEFLGLFNTNNEKIDNIAVGFFNYKSNNYKINLKSNKITSYYPVINTIVNACFLCAIIGFFAIGGLRTKNNSLKFVVLLGLLLWLVNMGFSILASPIVFRYEIFPLVVQLCITGILVERIYKSDQQEGVIA